MSTITIHESDTTGRPTATYVFTSTLSTKKSSKSENPTSTRVDVVPTSSSPSGSTSSRTSPLGSTSAFLTHLLTPFLPVGYPQTVSPDYTTYQIYDSLQAFASTIAGLLASRAVLVGLGVGSESASATTAMLLSIAQESIGRFATIFFAHYFALRIEAEVKYYRFLADIVNDVAFVLDCLSPSLPTHLRVPTLCASSACRAVCGVCGGSSKAILSAHFALAGNIGELNAKDGSQETVVSLVGMWAGGLIVSRVEGAWATWTWLLGLLGCHLLANWMAVKSVRLRTLNQGRCSILLERLLDGKEAVGPEIIGAAEGIFSRNDLFKAGGREIGCCSFGSISQLLTCMGGQKSSTSKSYTNLPTPLDRLLQVFQKEKYLLWTDPKSRQSIIVLKEGADSDAQLRSCCHAMRIAREIGSLPRQNSSEQVSLDVIERTLASNLAVWAAMSSKILEAGWNLSGSSIETSLGRRVRAQLE